jgi:hypothetical protein
MPGRKGGTGKPGDDDSDDDNFEKERAFENDTLSGKVKLYSY